MAVEGKLLEGEVTENPKNNPVHVEGMLLEFIRALIRESAQNATPISDPVASAPLASFRVKGSVL